MVSALLTPLPRIGTIVMVVFLFFPVAETIVSAIFSKCRSAETIVSVAVPICP